jgi:hypothetical protein
LFEVAAAAFLLWLAVSPIGPRPIGLIGLIVLVFWLIRVYLKHLPQIKGLWFSFLALSVLAWFVLGPIGLIGPIGPISPIGPIGSIGLIGLIVLYAVAFFVLLGIANFLFKNNQAVYNLFNTLLMVGAFLVSFSIGFVWWRPILLGLFLFMLFREVLNFHGVAWRRRSWVVCLTLAFLGLELGAVVSFLPLGPFNATAFLALFLFLVRDAALAFFQGRLALPVVFRQVTVFVILTIVIFAASTWQF